VLDEYLSSADDRFLPALRQFHEPKKLAAIADRWKKDHRPWARQQIFAYLDLGPDVRGHQPIVKRLFKWAEEKRDDELMAAFAVAFDQMIRRVRRTRYQYDYRARQSWQEEYLASPPDGDPFSYHTRHYLRRRAWRYFRRKGFQKPADYCAAVAPMLRRYTDDMLKAGENLLDSWSLMHACFGKSDLLLIKPSSINLAEGRSLAELTATPYFEPLWAKPEMVKLLVDLLSTAQSQAVRMWSIQLLRRHHMQNLSAFTPQEILALLDHEDEQVQQFAAEMLERSPALPNLELATWLKLLETRNNAALEIITRLMFQHVKPERLTIDQMVDIANAQPVAVARIGLKFLQGLQARGFESPGFAALARLSNARSASVAGEITTWALSILGTAENYNVDHVVGFFDSLQQTAREAAWTWLNPQSPAFNDTALWSRLIETPYDDVRFHVVAELERRSKLPGTSIDQISIVWTTVLLGVHRGGRAKLAALKQISRAIADDPTHAEPLLPVLAVSIRSVRLPEVRTGLAALVAALEVHPPLAATIAKYIPELQLAEEAAA
jgi:hypothetical protein